MGSGKDGPEKGELNGDREGGKPEEDPTASVGVAIAEMVEGDAGDFEPAEKGPVEVVGTFMGGAEVSAEKEPAEGGRHHGGGGLGGGDEPGFRRASGWGEEEGDGENRGFLAESGEGEECGGCPGAAVAVEEHRSKNEGESRKVGQGGPDAFQGASGEEERGETGGVGPGNGWKQMPSDEGEAEPGGEVDGGEGVEDSSRVTAAEKGGDAGHEDAACPIGAEIAGGLEFRDIKFGQADGDFRIELAIVAVVVREDVPGYGFDFL